MSTTPLYFEVGRRRIRARALRVGCPLFMNINFIIEPHCGLVMPLWDLRWLRVRRWLGKQDG